ncbi:APC family permease [Amycolatopsis sp. FDAARGOS 1241]|uniref:APC family permease n=1 Tax=Amycolatopsis sp. FDAARGOS 1241 TaxID=2778070 RepID=UPI001950C378|nr:APC family permease [Amycolatopsis sp. FDAARGOS 1241]QRP48225.1 APC family permease [Amycolatopsis sp. FDAARGOS 1241]
MGVDAGTAPPARAGAAGDDKRLKKHFGPIGLLFTAVGSVIGSGWLFGALDAAELAGPAAIVSWGIGAVMFVLIGMTYAELGTMFPHSGGVARFPHYSFGSFASFSMGWVTWIAAAAVSPIEVLAVVQYATNYLPWLERLDADKNAVLTPAGTGICIALLAVFVLVNFFGVRWFARINNVLVWWKLAIIALVIVVFLFTAFDGSHFSSYGGFAPYGVHGIFSAVASAGIAFSFFGFRQGVELAGETSNPKRNVPLTLIGSVVLTGVLYVLLQIAFIGAVPSDAVAKQGWVNVGTNFSTGGDVLATFGPLAAIAGVLGIGWLAALLYADAIISPGDTGLIYTGVTARISYAMGRNRNAPSGLAKVNKTGVPWVSLILAFIVGCFFFLPFPGWSQLVSFVTNSTVLSFGSGPLVLLAMRRQLPNQVRPFRLGRGWAGVIAFLALFSTNLIIYWTGWDTNWKLFVVIVFGYVLMALNQALGKGRTPRMDFRHGWWVLVWFAGLALISYLGNYPEADKHAGNLSVLDFNLGALASLVLTVIVMALALNSALPQERVEEILAEHREDDDAAGEAALP